jgi:hypothetical protein
VWEALTGWLVRLSLLSLLFAVAAPNDRSVGLQFVEWALGHEVDRATVALPDNGLQHDAVLAQRLRFDVPAPAER